MMKPSEFQTTIENQFDYICKVAMEDNVKTSSKRCPDSANGKPCSVIWMITLSAYFLPKTPIHPTSILLKWMDLLSVLKTAC